MAYVFITFKIMPESPSSNLENISKKAKEILEKYGKISQEEIVPVAFGIKSINITLVMDEKKGSTESIEEEIKAIDEVQNVDIISIRRALG